MAFRSGALRVALARAARAAARASASARLARPAAVAGSLAAGYAGYRWVTPSGCEAAPLVDVSKLTKAGCFPGGLGGGGMGFGWVFGGCGTLHHRL